jgi:hypothetical protein
MQCCLLFLLEFLLRSRPLFAGLECDIRGNFAGVIAGVSVHNNARAGPCQSIFGTFLDTSFAVFFSRSYDPVSLELCRILVAGVIAGVIDGHECDTRWTYFAGI